MLYNIHKSWGKETRRPCHAKKSLLGYSMDTDRNMLTRESTFIITDIFFWGGYNQTFHSK